MSMENFIFLAVGVLVVEFVVKRLLDLYLYVKEQLNEKTKH
ncbi:hypothetical protein [Granulicatella sp. zg-ZJ]|nr:hypothetical protein [Granulicatella sp. zg-ZJ]